MPSGAARAPLVAARRLRPLPAHEARHRGGLQGGGAAAGRGHPERQQRGAARQGGLQGGHRELSQRRGAM